MNYKNMSLKTERLNLRPLNINDLQSLFSYYGNIENTKYMYYLPHLSINETKTFLENIENEFEKENPDFFEFAITLNNKHIGSVCLYLCEDKSISEIGWALHKDYWGKGYITEAVIILISFAKEKLKIKKLVAHCDILNTASYKVMQRIGMKLVSNSGTRTYRDDRKSSKEIICEMVI